MTTGSIKNSSILRLLFFGDSFVNGTGDTEHRGGWVGRLCADAEKSRAGLRHFNLGIGGETSAELSRRWLDEAMRRYRHDYELRLVFQFGTNDTRQIDGRQLLTIDQSARHATAILSESTARWATLLVGLPPVIDAEHQMRNRELAVMLADVAARCRVPFFNSFQALLHSREYMDDLAATDGIHPGPAGYAAWACLLAAWPEWWFNA